MSSHPLRRRGADVAGAALAERGLLTALVSVAAAGALVGLGSGIGDVFQSVAPGRDAAPAMLAMVEAPARPGFTPAAGEAPPATPRGVDAPRVIIAPASPRSPDQPAPVPAARVSPAAPAASPTPPSASAPVVAAAEVAAPHPRPGARRAVDPLAAEALPRAPQARPHQPPYHVRPRKRPEDMRALDL